MCLQSFVEDRQAPPLIHDGVSITDFEVIVGTRRGAGALRMDTALGLCPCQTHAGPGDR